MAISQREIDSYPPPVLEAADSEITLLGAIRRHWILVVLPTIALVAVAVVVALLRPPVYTAQARLNVGRVDVSTQSIPGFVEGSQALAASYSQAVDAQAVIEPISQRLGLPPEDVAERLSGSSTPDSPLFLIEATGSTEQATVELANLGSRSLINYVTELNRSNPSGRRLLRDFRAAAREFFTATAEEGRLRARLEADPENRSVRRAFQRAQATTESAQLRRQTLRDLYQTSQQGQASSDDVIQVLSFATAAESDRRDVLQLLVFIGLVAGLAIGVAMAMARASAVRAQAARA